MHFTIDEKRYTVAISADPLIIDGQPCRAKFDGIRRRIKIADEVPKHERRRLLLHELRHAWTNARGLVNGEEADAVDAGEMMDSILEQYMQQGGDDVLESLMPEMKVSAWRAPKGSLAMVTAHCGYCEAAMSIGSIAGGAAEWNADLGQWIMERGILCDLCDRVTVWRETSTAEGMPKGEIVHHPAPCVLVGKDAAAWIAEHQGACRVMVNA